MNRRTLLGRTIGALMVRTNKPRLIRPDLVHDKHFAGQIGIQTPATIGQRTGELAAEKQQLVKAPAVGGAIADNTAVESLLTTLHKAGGITDETSAGFIDSPIYHDVNAGVSVHVSETIDVSMEVRSYNAFLGGADIVVTLPATSDIPPGKIFTFHRNDASGFKVTITAVGGDVIDNAPTYELIGSNSCITIMSIAVSGWIITSRNNGNTPFFETVSSVGQLMTAGSLTANTAYLTRVRIHEPMPVARADYALAITGAFNVDIGIYYSDGTTLRRLTSSGSYALGGANAVGTAVFTATAHVYPSFDYYVGLVCDSATPTFYKFVGNAFITAFWEQTLAFASAFPLPSTLTIASATVTGNQPWVLVEPQ